MRQPKTAYELCESQVQTPGPVVALFWKLLGKHRTGINRVLDMGAGDGKFAIGGAYKHYDGVEIDPQKAKTATLPKNARMHRGCVFRYEKTGYDACIGNPPYVRHHDVESPWKERTVKRLAKDVGIELDGHGNLYLYFLALGLQKTRKNGIVALVIPFEWVSRPSAKAVREFIHSKKWNVTVYRFKESIFEGVLTTASISIIDKSSNSGEWKFFDVSSDLTVTERQGISGSEEAVLPHSPRDAIWARRGMSPGNQKVFTLTEGERIHAGLHLSDVAPCVTSLKYLPKEIKLLNQTTFKKHFVQSGQRCWLIKSNITPLSQRLRSYLNNVSHEERQTYTCLNQEPWYDYETGYIPDILFHSGFTEFGPKVVINSINAYAVGSVYGIHFEKDGSKEKLQDYLLKFDFESRVVAHAKKLKKVEVKQVNTVLSRWLKTKT